MFTNSKNVKRIIGISAAALCMISSLRIAPLSQPDLAVAADGTLTAFEITEAMQIGWNLGNTLDATASTVADGVLDHAGLETETSWGQPRASQEIFDAIKAKGFNTIRIPTTWFQHLDENDNIDPEWMARVHEVVDYAYKNDMYVILNLHHENWVNRADLGTAYDVMKPRLLKLWEQIATEFKDYDQHLIFECMNEPRAVGTDHEWWGPRDSETDTINKLNADFVKLIRSMDSPYAKTRLLMIPGYCASSDSTIFSKIVVPDDEFVAVSIHAYSPYDFAMNAAVEDHSTFTAKYSNDLAAILDGLRKTFTDNDIPVVIGEFGTSNFDNTEARCEWATQYITTTKKYGIPCVLWDNDARGNEDASERHDYMNRRTLEWYEDSVQVVDTMMSIINDKSIVWGSERKAPVIEHDDIDSGKIIFDDSIDLDSSVKGKESTESMACTWDMLEGNDVAVQYTGDEPIIAFMDGSWKNWTEVKPYDVDTKNGIAYYSSVAIASAWGEDKLDELSYLSVKTTGKSTILKVSIIKASGAVVEPPPATAKVYTLDLANVGRAGELIIVVKGEPNTMSNGCVGFMGAEDWEQIEWTGTTDDEGNLVIRIPLEDIPANVTAPQFQIWLNFEVLDMESYNVVSEPGPLPSQPTDPTDDDDIVYGDANCDNEVNLADAVLIMQFSANPDKYGLNKPDGITEQGKKNADVTGNGDGVTNLDALAIQKFKLGLVASLPIVD